MLYLAVLRAGFVYLPLNTAYQAGEIDLLHRQRRAGRGGVQRPRTSAGSASSRSRPAAATSSPWTTTAPAACCERAALHADKHEPRTRGADDLAAILYTSGTTGRSKGAMLTHGNMLSNARTLKRLLGLAAAGDVLMHALPIFHVHGLFVASHGALLNGSRMIWFDRFDPRVCSRACRRPPSSWACRRCTCACSPSRA